MPKPGLRNNKDSEASGGRSNSVSSLGVDEGQGSNAIEVVCGICSQTLRGEDRSIRCQLCEGQFHIGCQGVPIELYGLIGKGGIHWFCKSCDGKVIGMIKTVTKLQEKSDKLEKDVEDNKRAIEIINEEMQSGFMKRDEEVKRVENEVKIEIDKVWAKNIELEEKIDFINRNGKSNSKELKIDTTVINRSDIVEEIEIDRRKQNLMIFGVDESENAAEIVDTIVTLLAEESRRNVVTNVGRIGRIRNDKSRPIRFTLSSLETRSEILKNAVKLKGSEFSRCYVVPDLTPKQQHEDKILRDKLKEIRDAEGQQANIKIKRGKIIKNVEGREVTLFPPSQRD